MPASALGTMVLVDEVGHKPANPSPVDRITLIGDAYYATGGTSGLAAELRRQRKDSRVILGAVCTGQRTASTGAVKTSQAYLVQYHPLTDKLQLIVSTTGNELAAAQDASATIFDFLVFSK